MACRQMLTKQDTLLRRWYHPLLSHIVHHGHEAMRNFQSPCLSQPGYGISDIVMSQIHTRNSIGGNGGFGSLCGQNKSLPAFLFPAAAAGVGPSLSRYMSSATGEGSDKVDNLGDIAHIFTDKTVEAVSSATPAVNEVAVAAADSAFPVAALQHLIDAVHSFTGLNWWAAIAVTTILIRGATLPLLISQLKATYKLNLIRPRLEEIKQTVQASGMDPVAVAEGQKEMNALLKQYGVSPLTPLKGLLIQGPIFVSFFLAISNMVEKVPSMKSGGALWFTDLTTPDSLFIFPVLASLSFLVLVEYNMQEGFEGNPNSDKMKKVSRIFAILAVPFTMGFPKALFCYWITSNLFSMSYGLAIRHPEVRKFLDLTGAPLSPPSTPTSQSQSELPSVSATQQQNTPSESKPPSESSKVADRRTSSHAIMKQRIRYLEEKLKGNKGRKKKKQ
ncbi:mitochondrial inner membrane protein OXA1-like isoform X1 [Chenopodium quinoa]|uniref:mitochondrial inner membrane protein OXA1-like isoform X1 n=1 Tax=Chenopodium quinoa TaxID=63459 RepID=UPI000B771A09|nr:mitochondrial inner membrane protein OXA1-like isoform X1 [Chenopodium quinoa]